MSYVVNIIRKSDYMIPNEVNIVLKDIWPMLLLFVIVLFTIRIIDIIINFGKVLIQWKRKSFFKAFIISL